MIQAPDGGLEQVNVDHHVAYAPQSSLGLNYANSSEKGRVRVKDYIGGH